MSICGVHPSQSSRRSRSYIRPATSHTNHEPHRTPALLVPRRFLPESTDGRPARRLERLTVDAGRRLCIASGESASRQAGRRAGTVTGMRRCCAHPVRVAVVTGHATSSSNSNISRSTTPDCTSATLSRIFRARCRQLVRCRIRLSIIYFSV